MIKKDYMRPELKIKSKNNILFDSGDIDDSLGEFKDEWTFEGDIF